MDVSRKGISDGSPRLVPRKTSACSRVSNGGDILSRLTEDCIFHIFSVYQFLRRLGHDLKGSD